MQSDNPTLLHNGRRGVMAASACYIVVASLGVVFVATGVYLGMAESDRTMGIWIGVIGLVWMALFTIIGYYLQLQRPWARIAGATFGALFLLVFPIGTIIGVLILRSLHQASKAGLFEAHAESPGS